MSYRKKFLYFLVIININFCLSSCLEADNNPEKAEIEHVNYPNPGAVVAARCENENTKKVIQKIKYLGLKDRLFPAKYGPPKFCGEQKILSYDYGFFECDYSAKWVSAQGEKFSSSRKLGKDEYLFLNWDKVINIQVTHIEMNCNQ